MISATQFELVCTWNIFRY